MSDRLKPIGFTSRVGILVVAIVCGCVAVLWSFAHTAVSEWRSSSILLANRRASEAAGLMLTALTRDMQGAQQMVLLAPDLQQFLIDPDYDIVNLSASAFARYPYPESVFAWRRRIPQNVPMFFNRLERPPAWSTPSNTPTRFPVIVVEHTASARLLADRIARDAAKGRTFSVFAISLGGVPYQVVCRLLYRDALHQTLDAFVGFTVNLGWVREHYFPHLTEQVARIASSSDDMAMVVVDNEGNPVSRRSTAMTDTSASERRFPLLFFDPLLVAADLPSDLPVDWWTVSVVTINNPSLRAIRRGTDWMLLFGVVAAVAAILGVALSVRAARLGAELATVRSDFVSAVSHELRTPIATIHAIGETLLTGRAEPRNQGDYARLIVQEAKRLTRFVENLLAFSRITDTAALHHREPVSLQVVVGEALEAFKLPLADGGFHVEVHITSPPPVILGDVEAIRFVLSNLIDNAIRYSGKQRYLEIRAASEGRSVVLKVIDRGRGIPANEVEHVTRKFYRGRNARSGGSGLGLAIVARIVTEHGGTLAIRSDVAAGTTVTVSLPMARAVA
jgi:signal transduction histidine kinase